MNRDGKKFANLFSINYFCKQNQSLEKKIYL